MKIVKSKIIDTIMNNKLMSRVSTYYNEQGLEICCTNSAGFRLDREYNEQGQEINYKDSTGLKYTKYYNEEGQEVKCKYGNGSGYVKKYNAQGLETVYLHTCGAYERKKYDEQGRIILKQDHLGNEYVYEYESIGEPQQMYDCKMINKNSGYEEYRIYDSNNTLRSFIKNNKVNYEYDEKGRIISEITKESTRYWKYEKEKTTRFLKQDGEIAITEFISYLDEKGRDIRTEFHDGKIIEYKYDDYDNCIYTKISLPNGDIGIVLCSIEYY